MIQHQLVDRGIVDGRVLSAMLEVDREVFVPPALRDQAWADGPQPVDCGQTISQPYVVARMLELLALRGPEHVLEVGTGTGYQAALLAHLARSVVTVERHAELAQAARANLVRCQVGHVVVRVADGTLGAADLAPFDAIIVAAGGPAVPTALLAQLAPGGRLVIPVGKRSHQTLLRTTRLEDGSLRQEEFETVVFVPLVGEQGWRG
jgi:protein-L-isoaspartate(D-aspartate) O-methyltransferase